MPYCKVNCIRLCCNGDPRAEYCGDFVDKDIMRERQPDCIFCEGYCECDHPTWQGFTIKIECFDKKFDAEYIAQILDEHFGDKCGEIEVQEGNGERYSERCDNERDVYHNGSIIKGGGVCKPGWMDNDQYGEYKMTAEYAHEVSYVGFDEPDDYE